MTHMQKQIATAVLAAVSLTANGSLPRAMMNSTKNPVAIMGRDSKNFSTLEI